MKILLIFLVGAVVGYLVGKGRARTTFASQNSNGQAEKEERKAKILKMFSEGREAITNNEVETLLGVSDRSATRYLEELEQEGKIEQIGRTGRSVTYRKR